MGLHPLTQEQQTLLDDYNQSGLSIYDYASQKGLSYSSVHYVVDKDRRLRNENVSNQFISIPLQNKSIDIVTNNMNNLISFNLNGLNISIDKNNLKQFLKVLTHD